MKHIGKVISWYNIPITVTCVCTIIKIGFLTIVDEFISPSFQNGDMMTFKNGSTQVTSIPATANPASKHTMEQVFEGTVTVEFETREGSGKAGKDFKYQTGSLVSSYDKYFKANCTWWLYSDALEMLQIILNVEFWCIIFWFFFPSDL